MVHARQHTPNLEGKHHCFEGQSYRIVFAVAVEQGENCQIEGLFGVDHVAVVEHYGSD